ncbi:unnamed protein product [Urochloa humidicola]
MFSSTTEAIGFMTTYGFSESVLPSVSNEVGAGKVDRAKNAVAVTIKLSVLLGLSYVLLLAFGHKLWASLFGGSAVIVSEFAAIMPAHDPLLSIMLDSAGQRSRVAKPATRPDWWIRMPLNNPGNDEPACRRVEGLRVAASRGSYQPGGLLLDRHAAMPLVGDWKNVQVPERRQKGIRTHNGAGE